jgi:hypothetical protein
MGLSHPHHPRDGRGTTPHCRHDEIGRAAADSGALTAVVVAFSVCWAVRLGKVARSILGQAEAMTGRAAQVPLGPWPK